MEDKQIWDFEEGLWTGDADHYRELIDPDCLMVLPAPPFVFTGPEAIAAVSDTPRWSSVALSEKSVTRPQEGLIVIAYKAEARKQDGESYSAHCTSVLRRLDHEKWRVVQHQQTPPIVAPAKS